jgi:hypothetical protein
MPTGASGTFEGIPRNERPYLYRDCGENYYRPSGRSEEDLMSTDAATQYWRDGQTYWDYDTGEADRTLGADAVRRAEEFRTMIWKGTNLKEGETRGVGFGFHCGTVLAWYCPNRPAKTNLRETLLNVCREDGSCADSEYICTKDGYDSCYNEMALAAHNEKRTQHCAPEPFTPDATMAKALQALLNESQQPTATNNPNAKKRPVAYENCHENFYAAIAPTTEAQVRETNVATEDWYGSKARYDFETGRGTPPYVAGQFTAMVWKGVGGATTDPKPDGKFTVAFARRFDSVIAWYCPSGANNKEWGINASGFAKKNVARSSCEKKCKDDPTDGFLKCYQTVAADEQMLGEKSI